MTTAAVTIMSGIPEAALRTYVRTPGVAPRAHRLAFWAIASRRPGFVHERVQEHQNEGSQMRRGARTKHQCRSIEDRLQPHACAPSHARRLSTFGLRVWGASGGGAGSPLQTGGQRQRHPDGRAGGPRAGSESACTCRRRGRWGGRARSRVGRTTRWAGSLVEPDGVSRDQTCAPSFGGWEIAYTNTSPDQGKPA